MVNHNKKIALVLGVPFPTSKAYGITTRETVIALLSENIDVRVFSPKGNYLDDDFKKLNDKFVNFSEGFLVKLLKSIGIHGSKNFNFISWRLGMVIQLFTNLKKIKSFSPDLIWVRDPLIALICLKTIKLSRIILEVHDSSGKLYYNNLKKYSDRILYCPINRPNKVFIECINKKCTQIQAPMGIRNDFIASKFDIQKFIGEFKRTKQHLVKICYLGNIAPNGKSKGIEDLVDLANYAFENSLINLKVFIIGSTNTELKNFKKTFANLSKFLEFREHVSHTEALKLMKSFDILILPKSKDSLYNGMPIKLLEYLASGRNVIVASNSIYSDLFYGEFSPHFYKSGDTKSLYFAVSKVIKSKSQYKHIYSGVKFASNFTWENRTKKIIKKASNFFNIWD